MQCKYFQDGDVNICIAFPNVFIPESNIVEEYCCYDRHKYCTFYINAKYNDLICIVNSFNNDKSKNPVGGAQQ